MEDADTVLVRPATLADLTTLRLMWEALYVEQARPYPVVTPEDYRRWTAGTAMRLERQIAGDTTVFIRLALDPDEKPLGFLSAWLEERTIGAPYHFWLVDHLYVIPEARGTLVGSALLSDAITYAVASGITVVECIALAGDDQWMLRGMTPTLVRYMVDVNDYQAMQHNRIVTRTPPPAVPAASNGHLPTPKEP